jgi:hypothetical protein
MNSLFVIAPYKHLDMWVFDDGARGLVQEPFVGGADLLIALATAGFESPEKGFRMVFSAGAFPGAGLRLEWRRAEMGGNVYFCEALGSQGWLCPALLKYFEAPPAEIYVQVRPRVDQ